MGQLDIEANKRAEGMLEYRTKLQVDMIKAGIPQHCQPAIYRYLAFGESMGSFLSAVFSNDLVQSFENADETNTVSMRAYAVFLYSACPISTWGNRKIVEKHKGFYPICSHCKRLKKNSVDCGKHTITPLWEWK